MMSVMIGVSQGRRKWSSSLFHTDYSGFVCEGRTDSSCHVLLLAYLNYREGHGKFKIPLYSFHSGFRLERYLSPMW